MEDYREIIAAALCLALVALAAVPVLCACVLSSRISREEEARVYSDGVRKDGNVTTLEVRHDGPFVDRLMRSPFAELPDNAVVNGGARPQPDGSRRE